MPEPDIGTLKRGMHTPWEPQKLGLSFNDYLNRQALPKVPKAFGYVRTNDVPWGMMGNDTFGCCVMAGAAHETMLWNLAAGRPAPAFSTQTVVHQYLTLTGGQDGGLNPLDTAKWRSQVGIADNQGVQHRVDAYASVDSQDFDTADLCCYLFGCVGYGFNLPDTAEREFINHHAWTDTSHAPSGGHYVPLAGRNTKGERFFVTWAALQGATDAWVEKYSLGAVAYMSQEFLREGVSPSAVKWNDLKHDWQQWVSSQPLTS